MGGSCYRTNAEKIGAMRVFVVIAMLFSAGSASVAAEREIRAVEGGVVCFSPHRLREGIVAANRGDDKWAGELGCVRLRAGVPGLLISPYLRPAQPLQVRLMPVGGEAATVWGYSVSFTTKSGAKLKFD